MAHVVSTKSHVAGAAQRVAVREGEPEQPQQKPQQQQLYAAYATVYAAHSTAFQLLAEGVTLFAAECSPTAEADKPLPSPTHPSTAEERRYTVEDLLLRFTDLQTALSPASSITCTTQEGAESSDDGRNDGEAAVQEAVRVLEACLPADLRESMRLPNAPVYAAAAAPAVLACPSDVVQLALLLRRHWTLQRDICLCIPALLDIFSRMQTEPADAASRAQHTETPVNAPQLSVVLALAVLQLRHAGDTLETRPSSQENEAIYTPTEQCLIHSFAQPLVASASNTVFTMLPLFLWQAWAECGAASRRSKQQQITSSARQTEVAGDRDEVTASLLSSREAAAAHGYATACAMTKQLCRWEAHLAVYVHAQLASLASSSPTPPPPSEREGGEKEGDSNRSLFTTKTDASFLASVQTELGGLRVACTATQLLWLTIAASLYPSPSSSPPLMEQEEEQQQQQRLQVLAVVLKRCGKVEKLLRSLWSSEATARLLLPGVLLWLGYATDARRHAEGGNDGGENSSSSNHSYTPSQECRYYWQEAYTLGQQVLGRLHPFVEKLASLLLHSTTAAAATTPSPTPDEKPYEAKKRLSADAGGIHRAAALAPTYRATTPLIPTQLPARSSALPALPRGTPSSTFLPKLLPPVSSQQQQQQPVRTATTPNPRLSPSPPPPRLPASSSGFAFAASTMPRPPGASRAFTTASSSAPSQHQQQQQVDKPASTQRARPLHTLLRTMHEPQWAGGNGGVGGAPDAFRNTFPPPHPFLFSADAATAADGGTAAAAATLPGTAVAAPRPPQLPRGKQALPTRTQGREALRRCYRLRNPEDAFTLFSSVRDAVFGSEAARKASTVQGKEKKRMKEETKGKRETIASTEALLLSADTEDSVSFLNDSSAGQDAGSPSNRPQRRQRPDRQLLPPLTEVRRTASANSKKSKSGDPASPSTNPPSSRARGREAPSSHTSVNDDGRSAETPASNSRKSTAYFAGSSRTSVKEREESEEQQEEDEEEDEEEDDDYNAETLPQRNARLQREIRTYFAQLNVRRVQAAAVIQRAWRCSRARRILHTRQQLLYRFVYIIQKAAALAIESFVLCVWEQQKRRAALAARHAADAQRRSLEQRQIAAAEVLTRAARRWGQQRRERRRLRAQLNLERDARLRLYDVTAVTVQRWWRTTQPQKAYWRRRNVEVEEQKRLRAEADRLARAATVIQKRVRGAQARGRVKELKRTRAAEALALRLKRDAAVTVLLIVLQEHVCHETRVAREAQARQENAAQCIADGWRSTVARRRMEVALQRARQLRTAATCMQRAWRRYFACRQRRYLRQIRRTLQEDRLARELRLSMALVSVQSAARGALAQLLAYNLKARVGRTFYESVLLLQAVSRAGQARQVLRQARLVDHARRLAATVALAQRRRHASCLVQTMLRAQDASYAVQQRRRRHLEEKLHIYSTAVREMRHDAAAIVVQRAVRRHQQRRRTAAAEAEAAAAQQYLHLTARSVQQAWRAHSSRKERRLRAAAVARCAQKRQEQEEVAELIWRDQMRELDVLCTLEQHYLAESEHAARVGLYQRWMHPDEAETDAQVTERSTRQNCADVNRWADLYVD
ncbi:hypothetical protein ABB37_08167 [Leptomonas pyrrhocoris]|uniref:Uncharacterized protein n=1 Tax=Leptomonas pyrrhocoris TaxID=157538 RepID=A0A0M9FTY5_LEPPY|nr:hypothetical protein ABB37_08167 [Leptomonas pyrrhocoris]KPA76025.1 hypothetical protein ABB37_08167 [Leptomonas pyrrhocoris]|eukprot:XP_015654464.1 hypothetical protein ABB37_08167 [Leptomonas pyrrhocoris]